MTRQPGITLATAMTLWATPSFAQTFTTVRDTTETGFSELYKASIDDGTVVYQANGSVGLDNEVYVATPGTAGTRLGPTLINRRAVPKIRDGDVAWIDENASVTVGQRVLKNTTPIAADGTSPPPGVAEMDFVTNGEAVIDGAGSVYYNGRNDAGLDGIYRDATATPIVDENDSVPGSPGDAFIEFAFALGARDETLAVDEAGTVAFFAEIDPAVGSNYLGLYTSDGTTETLIVDENTTLPTGVGTYSFFRSYLSIDEGEVAFSTRAQGV